MIFYPQRIIIREKGNQIMSKSEFAKYLVDHGRINELLDQSYVIPPDKASIIAETEQLLKLRSALMTKEEPIMPEGQKPIINVGTGRFAVFRKIAGYIFPRSTDTNKPLSW